jgi:hypothetical protein
LLSTFAKPPRMLTGIHLIPPEPPAHRSLFAAAAADQI